MSVASRNMDQPHDIHWREAKRILNFVQGTKNHGIQYVAQSSLELVGFMNSDWEGDNTDRKSTFGYFFMLAHGPFNWSSENESSITHSYTEVEHIGDVNATTQCLWLQGILGDFGIESDTSTFIYYDNQSTI